MFTDQAFKDRIIAFGIGRRLRLMRESVQPVSWRILGVMTFKVKSIPAAGSAIEEFIDLPWRLHADDRRWIPPSRDGIRWQLSTLNPFFEYGAMQCFIAFEGTRVAGRCAGFINDRLVKNGNPIGLVGFFECEENFEIAEALLDQAISWLGENGCSTIWGPMDFSIWHGYRFMTKGFGHVPFYSEPYNPAYYPEFFWKYGFETYARWFSWEVGQNVLEKMRSETEEYTLERLAEAGLKIVPSNPRDFQANLVDIYQVMIAGFEDNVGFTPIGLKEFSALFGPMQNICLPEITPIVRDLQNTPQGFVVMFPDIGVTMRQTAGGLPAFDQERIVYYLVVLLETVRGKGVMGTIVNQCWDWILQNGKETLVGAMVKEGPCIFDRFGVMPNREYTLFSIDQSS